MPSPLARGVFREEVSARPRWDDRAAPRREPIELRLGAARLLPASSPACHHHGQLRRNDGDAVLFRPPLQRRGGAVSSSHEDGRSATCAGARPQNAWYRGDGRAGVTDALSLCRVLHRRFTNGVFAFQQTTALRGSAGLIGLRAPGEHRADPRRNAPETSCSPEGRRSFSTRSR